MTLFTDSVQNGIERALDAVALRQRVTSNNLANAMTPGFRAQRVDFESSLAAALGRGDGSAAEATVRDAGTPARSDGNTVVVEDEATAMMRNGLQYQALVEAANYKFSSLRTAIEGR